MRKLFGLAIAASWISYAPLALAAGDWFEVTTNAVGDRFMVDQASIQTVDGSLRYWEYRDFQRPNNAFVEEELEAPVHGVMLYQSVDCTTGVSRLRQRIVHDRNRQELQRHNYGNDGSLSQPAAGSSAAAVLQYVCNQQNAPAPQTPEPEQ